MKIITNISDLRSTLNNYYNLNKKIALVPTMGSLHEGHLSLINFAQKKAEIVIVTIFINKAQFNDSNDFKLYPRNLENDINKLAKLQPDIIFAPDDSQIYDDDFAIKISVNKFNDCLCASSRLGHFDGVALIITKLFNLIKPNIAIFGEKDFQQTLIIKKLVKDLNFDIEIITMPTYREKSGLAMSSRNSRLSENGKKQASLIYNALNEIRLNPLKIEQVKMQLLNNGFTKIDYLEIRRESDLKLINNLDSNEEKRIFIAIYLEGIRLIDNLKI
jgi:pantoate--beta-alanine ligase